LCDNVTVWTPAWSFECAHSMFHADGLIVCVPSPPTPVETGSTTADADALFYATIFTSCNLASDAASVAAVAELAAGIVACPDENLSESTACLAEETASTVAKYAEIAASRVACIAGGYPPAPPSSSPPAPPAVYPGEQNDMYAAP
jgi:hypothetical protein